jgi:predicted O-methyltransferase YrrM
MTDDVAGRTLVAEPALPVRHAIEVALATRHEADVSWLGRADLSSAWALAPDALRFLARLIPLLRPHHVLELGSGASTRVLARAIGQLDPPGHVTSVDHDPEFVASTRRQIEADGTAHLVGLQLAPLVVRSRFDTLVPVYGWNRAAFVSAEPADVVLIDGPPSVLGGRQGALYQVLEASREGTLILLDDASRKRESKVLQQWASDCGAAIGVQLLPGLERGMAAILVGDLSGIADRVREQSERPGE